jgi:hypothetical protein
MHCNGWTQGFRVGPEANARGPDQSTGVPNKPVAGIAQAGQDVGVIRIQALVDRGHVHLDVGMRGFAVARRPSGAATRNRHLILPVQPACLEDADAAAALPPVASIGSRRSAVRSLHAVGQALVVGFRLQRDLVAAQADHADRAHSAASPARRAGIPGPARRIGTRVTLSARTRRHVERPGPGIGTCVGFHSAGRGWPRRRASCRSRWPTGGSSTGSVAYDRAACRVCAAPADAALRPPSCALPRPA